MEITVNKRKKKIVELLLSKKEFVSSSELASSLCSSEKTIHNEIRSINALFPCNLISSKKGRGYIIEDKENWKDIQINTDQEANRDIQILKQILFNKSVDYYELADLFFISTSTLNKDIAELNKRIQKEFKTIKIIRKQNEVSLNCDQEIKRRVLTYFLLEEKERTALDMNVFRCYFENFNVVELSQIISDYVHEKNLALTDFNIYFVLLHILILVSNKEYISNYEENSQESNCFVSFIRKIEDCLSLHLNQAGIEQIQTLMDNRETTTQEHADLIIFVDKIFKEIVEIYNVNFCENEDLKQNLSLHLSNLRQRCKNERLMKNPLLSQIKQNFVLVYDIAAFVASQFKEKTGYDLDEHEISFIALHILNGIKQIKGNTVRIAIVNPYGASISNVINSRIHEILDIEIIGTFSAFDYNALYKENPELVISLVDHNYQSKFQIFKLNNYFDEEEYNDLQQVIKDIKVKKNYQNIIIQNYFHKELFCVFDESKSKGEIIDVLCQKLEENGYANPDFKTHIYEREAIAPTCFGSHFAIPHTTKKVALKSGIAVALFENPISWDGNLVNAVFMFALHKSFDQVPKLYDVLLAVFDNPKKFNHLIETKSFTDFVKQIIV